MLPPLSPLPSPDPGTPPATSLRPREARTRRAIDLAQKNLRHLPGGGRPLAGRLGPTVFLLPMLVHAVHSTPTTRRATGNYTNHVQPENLLHIVHAHHFAGGHASRTVAGEQQMLLHAPRTAFGKPGLAREQPQDAIRVANRGDFRVHDHDRAVGEVHGQVRTLLDAGRGVAQHDSRNLRRAVH